MPLPQTKLREVVLQLLFAFEMNQDREEELIPLLMSELKTTRQEICEAFNTAREIQDHVEHIDATIEQVSLEYAISRIHNVEKIILRLSIYDLIYKKQLPEAVVIAEALRLEKKFGTPDGIRFIHGILDTICQQYRNPDASLALSHR